MKAPDIHKADTECLYRGDKKNNLLCKTTISRITLKYFPWYHINSFTMIRNPTFCN